MAGTDRRFCKKCDRSFRHVRTTCPICGRKLSEPQLRDKQVRTEGRRRNVEPLPPLPSAARLVAQSSTQILETPDYLGADPSFRGSDDPLAHERWEKSPRLAPDEAMKPPEVPLTAAGWAVVAIGAVIEALGND